jgi:antitoxin VapB
MVLMLNIKNPEAHRLAQELAALTGESMATAVTEALRESLIRRRGSGTKPLAERLLAIGKDCAGRIVAPYRTIEHGDLLYGEDGLPR